jgi:hypothetical protein
MNKTLFIAAAAVADAQAALEARYEVVPFDGEDLSIRNKLVVIANGFEKPEGEQTHDFDKVRPVDALAATVAKVSEMFPASKRLYVRCPLDCNVQELNPDWPDMRAGVVASIRCVGDEVLPEELRSKLVAEPPLQEKTSEPKTYT